jgi:predicted enzyme related to lactoylglutathione lyase
MTTSDHALALYLTEIKVTDWPALVRWYVTNLGLRLSREDAPHQYALLEFESGSGRIALKGGRPAGTPSGPVRLVFEAANVDDVRARLTAAGVDVSLPEQSPEGYCAIRLRDPEGTPITVFSWKSKVDSHAQNDAPWT